MDFLQICMLPFSFLMTTLYQVLFSNYGVTLIVFALFVKIILFPFSLKGKRSMIQMNMLQGRMKQIQTKYANDREKQNQEIQNLYAKENVNPMGGCLWSMLPLFILLPLYAVVRRPIRYLMGQTDAVIEAITEVAVAAGVTLTQNYPEISIVSAFHTTPDILAKAQAVAGDAVLFGMDFNFLGIDLSVVPSLKFWENGITWGSVGLFLIPLISAVCSFFSSRIMMKTNAMNQQGGQGEMASNTKMMMWMSPVMSLYIGYIMPAGLGIYWIANSVLGVAQELLAARILRKDYAAAAAAREAQELAEKEEEKQKRREAMERKAQAIADGKNKKKKKDQAPVEKPKKDTAVIAVSGVGTRAYARGRAYDPTRFSPEGPTAYRDFNILPEDVEKEAPQIPAEEEPVAVPTPVQMPEEVTAPEIPMVEETDPWAGVEQEMNEIAAAAEEISDKPKA